MASLTRDHYSRVRFPPKATARSLEAAFHPKRTREPIVSAGFSLLGALETRYSGLDPPARAMVALHAKTEETVKDT